MSVPDLAQRFRSVPIARRLVLISMLSSASAILIVTVALGAYHRHVGGRDSNDRPNVPGGGDGLARLVVRDGPIVGGTVLAALAVAAVLASRLQRTVSDPLLELASAAAEVAAKRNYSVRMPCRGDDEFGRLAAAFNTILTQLEQREQAMEQEKYRRLTEEITDIVWEVDDAYRLTYISPADERLRGYSASEMLGRDPGEFLDEASAARLQAIRESRSSVKHPTADAVTFEARQRCKDGRYVWTEISARVFRDATGRVIGARGTTRDISARKEMEEQLHVSQQRLRHERDMLQTLLDASPDSIYFKDLQSRFVRISRSKALKVLEGAPRLRARYEAHPGAGPVAAVVGTTDFDAYDAGDAQRAYEDEQDVILTGHPIVNKLERQVYQDGSVMWNLTSKMPWCDNAGNMIGTFGVSKDITELKVAEEKLEKVNKQLIEASRQAGMAEVATGVLHNVGNALNSVNVSANLVLDQIRASRSPYLVKVAAMFQEHANDLPQFLAGDPKGQKLPAYLTALAETLRQEQQQIATELDELRRNIDHIKEIVAMQQTYARVAGVIEPVPVAEIVEDAIRMNSAALARHEVNLIREFSANPVIQTDRHKVLQILVNLLRNAKYACDDSGRIDKEITVRITLTEGRVHLAVADNGVGIPAENLVRIFSHGFTTRKAGHGFGLHSGALAAKDLGGTLHAESPGSGKGATFVLDLPLDLPLAPAGA
jgi:PAS domain S-box-containing protein